MKRFTHGGRRTNSTKRVEDFLQRLGFSTANVEKKVNIPGKIFFTRDAFGGIADVIAVHRAYVGTLYVQLTSGANHNAHLRKILALAETKPEAGRILQSLNSICVISWETKGTGKRRISMLDYRELKSVEGKLAYQWDDVDLPTDKMVLVDQVKFVCV